jgi:hypothetical protein
VSLAIEDRVLGHLLFGAVPVTEVDLLLRNVPFVRDVFDEFVYAATQYSIMEGTWDTFVGGGRRYLAVTRHQPSDLVPPLIPPQVAATVADIMSQFRRRQPGEPIIHGHSDTTAAQHHVGEELMLALGGDHGDGVHAAGTRAFSMMMSARIGDGFVHPVIGGRVWSSILATRDPHGGKHLTVLPSIATAVDKWRTSPADRPRWERIIIDYAHSLGWRTPAPTDGYWSARAAP